MLSFFRRRERCDIAPYLRRICDRSTPNNGSIVSLDRQENRYNRSLPVLLWSWQNGRPSSQPLAVAITKDITDHGMGILVNQTIHCAELVVGILSSDGDQSEVWFFLGNVVRNDTIGAGYRIIGVELTEFLNIERSELIQELLPEAERLMPAPSAV